jgi:hypothetical protein
MNHTNPPVPRPRRRTSACALGAALVLGIARGVVAPVLGLGALALIATTGAYGQAVTTSAIEGRVTDQSGNAIGGATVVITHEPTGSRTTVTSRPNGTYSVRGLRPGGPYSVTVDALGFATGTQSNINLGLDQAFDATVALRGADVIELEAFEVADTRALDAFRPDNFGSGTNMSNEDIEAMPTGDRSLNALAASDPRITYNRDPFDQAISVSGVNNRYNSIQVDGVSASDPFGLNSNNTAAARNVIPLDAVEAISISSAPYSARNAGFTGARINATTKSGTNQFRGSVYYTYRDQDWVGTRLDANSTNAGRFPLPDFKEQTWGMTLGGPIIKNQLFFFLSYEKVDDDRIAPSPVAAVQPAALQQIIAKAQSLGIDPGSPIPPTTNKLTDESITAKVDWEINQNHRASFRYSSVEASRPAFPGFGTGAGANNLSFDSHWYDQLIENTSYIAQLISRWNERLNTEISVSRSEYYSEPKWDRALPMVQIRGVPAVSGNDAWVTFGVERSRHANLLEVDTNNVEIFANYELNERNTLQAGLQYEKADVYNLFVQDTLGNYRWNTLQSFLDTAQLGGGAGEYNYKAIIPGVNPAAEFDEGNWGVFVQNVQRPRNDLTLTYGVRADMPVFGTDIPRNALFEQVFGVRNDYTYDGKISWQPRFGFNWQPQLDRPTQIRGGFGLFYGRVPRVWMSNSYSNTGSNFATYQSSTNPVFSSDVNNQPTPGTPGGVQTVAFVRPGFELPSTWKGNLAVERQLDVMNLVASAEIEFSFTNKDILNENLNLRADGTMPDGRIRYTGSNGRVDTRFGNRIIGMKNTSKGDSRVITLSVEKPQTRSGWYWRASYVNTHANEVQYGTSSVAASNWQNRSIFNPGEDVKSTAELEVRHAVRMQVRKTLRWGDGYRTNVSLIYNGRSGLPYSLVFTNDYNNDGLTLNDLFYAAPMSQLVFPGTSAQPAGTAQALYSQIMERHGISEGDILKSGSERYPWVNQFDFRLSQEVPLPGWRHSLELGMDILNVGNLLNDSWGLIRGSNSFFVKRESVASVVYNAATNTYSVTNVNTNLANGTFAPSLGRGEPAASRWSILFSAKYKF